MTTMARETDAGETGAGLATVPQVLEAGRYKLSQDLDGSLHLGRATGLCDACTGCGCGAQSPPVHIPAMVMKMAKGGMLGRMLGGLGGVPDGNPGE